MKATFKYLDDKDLSASASLFLLPAHEPLVTNHNIFSVCNTNNLHFSQTAAFTKVGTSTTFGHAYSFTKISFKCLKQYKTTSEIYLNVGQFTTCENLCMLGNITTLKTVFFDALSSVYLSDTPKHTKCSHINPSLNLYGIARH